MITLYSGIPGSGKTYKMVHDLLLVAGDFYVVHNIDGLADGVVKQGVHFVQYCAENNLDVVDFFSKEYQITFTETVREKYGKNCLVVVDEAHEWFDKNKKNLKMWLSYHRHLNQTIWLVAHRSSNLPAVYRTYIEVEFRAKSSSIICLPGFFMYNRLAAGESMGFKFVRKKQKVFAAYKSQTAKFEKKKASLVVPAMLLFVALGFGAFFSLPAIIAKGKKPVEESKVVNPVGSRADVKEPGQIKDSGLRYVGYIGEAVIVEDAKTGKSFNLADLPQKYLLMQKGQDYVKVFDLETKVLLTADRRKALPPLTVEAAKTPLPGKREK